MQYTKEQLKAVMDTVRNDPSLAPVKNQYGITTFCNLNAYRVAQALGLNIFFNYDADRPMLANEDVAYMDANPQLFSKFESHAIAHDLAGKGYLIYAAQAGEVHGHIAPVYPSDLMITSGKWACQVSYISNVGETNSLMGVNWGFAMLPFYYLVI